MRAEIEALGSLVDVASDLEVGLANLAKSLDGDFKIEADRLTSISDGLADTLTAIYIELAKVEVVQSKAQNPTAT